MAKKTKNQLKARHRKKVNDQIQGLRERALKVLESNLGRPFSIRQLSKRLGLPGKGNQGRLLSALATLQDEDLIYQPNHGKYQATREPETVTGIVDHVNPRVAFIISEKLPVDARVRGSKLNGALHGDTVEIELLSPYGPNRQPDARVTKVVKRGRSELVGRLDMGFGYGYVIPDDRKYHFEIYVREKSLAEASDNDKVIVKLTKWPAGGQHAEGEIIKVLGPAGEHEAEIHSIMAEFGLPFDFPTEVTAAAEALDGKITKKDYAERRDFREIETFTVDPVDAKDFDDALSFRELPNGHYEVGVHIADVSHYVHPKTVLDKEAVDRATSVYLVDRTIPMLPENLSNGLCSLRPHEEKLTFSAVFEVDDEAHVHDAWFGRTVIYSDHRFSYEEAQEGIESGEGKHAPALQLLNSLAKKLRDQRFARGSINFDTPEVRFRLDEKGKPLEVIPKVRVDAHKMIEEWMLLANKKVAEFIYFKELNGKKGKHPFVYRTHDQPDPEKLQTFGRFAATFGYKIRLTGNDIAAQLNTLLDEVEGRPEQHVLETLAIRSMAKAKYTTQATGHFGLGFSHYTHFTSPIRRYPDVMVHRLLQHYLDEGKPVNAEDYERLCMHSSEREKRASDAERASIKYKQVEFMSERIGEEYSGIVSGVTEWGIFVEISETQCEGMVRLADIGDDYYQFDEKFLRVIGQHSKRMISLGDRMRVRVVETDMDRRTIDLEFIFENEN